MEFLKIWEILLRRKWIIIGVFFAFFSAVVIATHLVTPIYEVKAKLLVETSDTLSSLLASLGLSSVGGSTQTSDDDYGTDVALVTIRPLLEEVISSLNLKDRKGETIKPEDLIEASLMNKVSPQPYLEVEQYEETDILEIISSSSDASEAVNMSNKLAELYIKDRLEKTKEEYKAARIFIEDQIEAVKNEYYNSLSAIKEFSIKEEIVDLDIETQNLISKITTLKTSYEDNEQVIATISEEIVDIEEKLKKQEKFRKDSEEFVQSDQIKLLKIKLSELLISIAEKSIDYTVEHPEYKQLEEEVNTVEDMMKDEAQVVFDRERFSIDPIYDELVEKLVSNYINKEAAFVKRKLLQSFIKEYEHVLLSIPLKRMENSKLELNLAVSQDIYRDLLGYMTQVGMAESITLSNIKLVESAEVTDEPDFPKKLLNYVLGVFLGLFWGLALAFFIEYIDDTIKSSEDMKQVKLLTLLGKIPKTKYLKKRNLVSNLNPILPIVETFRTIKNSIRYASIDKPIKALVVTSSIEGEGKSSIASNIAITFSTEEKKVILVDLNLRRPSLHNFFHISNNRGIANVLTENLLLEEVITRTNIEGLDVLTTGPASTAPGKLVDSQKLKDILNILRENYDIVIIDMPPVIAFNDAVHVGTMVDGILYVIEAGKVSFSMVEHAKEEMLRANLNVIGVILNKFKTLNIWSLP